MGIVRIGCKCYYNSVTPNTLYSFLLYPITRDTFSEEDSHPMAVLFTILVKFKKVLK